MIGCIEYCNPPGQMKRLLVTALIYTARIARGCATSSEVYFNDWHWIGGPSTAVLFDGPCSIPTPVKPGLIPTTRSAVMILAYH
jgi:hypothetical protein